MRPTGRSADDDLVGGQQVPRDPAAARELLRAGRAVQAEAGAQRPLPDGVAVERTEAGEWVRPVAPAAGPPILHLHGGGYALGSPESHRLFAARLALAARRPVLLAAYRQVPEAPFPAGLDDAARALEGIGTPALLSGDSAGGGLALALLVRLRDAGAPLPARAALLSPWVDLGAGARWRDGSPDASLDPAMLALDAQAYAGAAGLEHPLVSPARADPAGLPPLLVQLSATELLRPDAEAFVARARAAGVAVEVRTRAGVDHGWQLGDGAAAQDSIAEAAQWLTSQN